MINAERQNRGEIPASPVPQRKARSTVSPERFEQAITDLDKWNPLPDSLGMWRMSLEDHQQERAPAASENSSKPAAPKHAAPKRTQKATSVTHKSHSPPPPRKRKRSSVQETGEGLPKASRKNLLQPSTPKRRKADTTDEMDIDEDDGEDEDTTRAAPPPRRTSNRLSERAARSARPKFYIDVPQLHWKDRRLYK